MNAEIVAALEEKFPPMTVDLEVIANFLDSLHRGPIDAEDREAKDANIDALNLLMSTLPNPYKIEEESGLIKFYPIRMYPDEIKNKERVLETLNEIYVANLSDEDKEELRKLLDD